MTDDFERSFEEPQFEDVPEQLAPREESLGIAWGFVAALLFVSLIAVFIVQNTDEMAIRFLWLEMRVSVWIVIMVAVLVTLIVDQLISIAWRRRRRKERRRSREERTEHA